MIKIGNKGNSEEKQTDQLLNLYRIYSDDLKKFDTICWQFPVALISANFFVLHWFKEKWIYLLAIFILNFFFLVPLMKHVHLRNVIKTALIKIEDELRKTYLTSQIADFKIINKYWWLKPPTLYIMAYGLVILNTLFFLIVLLKLVESYSSHLICKLLLNSIIEVLH